MSADKLEALLAIISSGVGEIKQAYASAGEPVPDPDAPYVPDNVEPGVETSKALVVAAALQLIAAVGNPGKILIDAVCGGVRPRGQLESDADVKPMGGKMLVTEALGVVLKLHVPEIVREAGPEGISAHDIAAKAHTSPDKLGRFMRFLASRHIFKELRPGVFVHNRLSSPLDSMKHYEGLASDPMSKFDRPEGLSALLGHATTDYLPVAPHVPAYMADPRWALTESARRAPFAYSRGGAETTLWEHYATPDGALGSAQFGAAMAAQQVDTLPSILHGFAWNELPKDSLVVDVGGGIGSAALAVLRAHPHLRFVIQDLPGPIADGRKYWSGQFPEAISSGQVQLQDHDMFTPQPVSGATVYIMRYIAHDWPTGDARRILQALAGAAAPGSKVLLVDYVVQYTCREQGRAAEAVPGADRAPPPQPLLQTAGYERGILMDILMMNMFNGQERTLDDFACLLVGSGWKLERVFHIGLHLPSQLVLVPDGSTA